MSDGNKTPASHDGMACFQVGNELRLIRNHEVANGKIPKPGVAIGPNHYDETTAGGTTTLVINPKTLEVINDFVSLSGTLINCAAGKTPWGSWISCEETTLGQAIRTNNVGGYPKPHGYCFEVFASANASLEPVPHKRWAGSSMKPLPLIRTQALFTSLKTLKLRVFIDFYPGATNILPKADPANVKN